MVPLGFIIDCRLASCPTRRSPLSVKATTDGVVRAPSALGMTIGSPPCQAAITELVVPRSIPTAVAIAFSSGLRCHSAAALRGQDAAVLFIWSGCGLGHRLRGVSHRGG